MVYVSVKTLHVLGEATGIGGFPASRFRELFGGDEEALDWLVAMYSMGLLERKGEVFSVSDAGKLLLEAWRVAGKPDADPWIDSRVYTMLTTLQRRGMDGGVPSGWEKVLGDRGFLGSSGREAASLALEALSKTSPRPVLIGKQALALLASPDGPAEKEMYPGDVFHVFEAMGLAVASAPGRRYYALTRSGRLVKRVVERINIPGPRVPVVSPAIRDLLETVARGGEIPGDKRVFLGRLGYITGAGALTPPAKMLLEAYALLENPFHTPPVSVTSDELRVLGLIDELWLRSRDNPELAPTRRLLKEWAARRGVETRLYTLGLTLHHLESIGLVREEYDEDRRRMVIRLTGLAKELRGTPGGNRPVTASGSRALVAADEALSMEEAWAMQARRDGLLGPGGPTRYGLFIQRLSRVASRSLFLTMREAEVLRRIPVEKSVSVEELASLVGEDRGDLEYMLGKLEARGLIAVLLDGRVLLTDIGRLVKEAVVAVPRGIATPVTPWIIRLLEAVEKLGTTSDVAKLVKETGLYLDELKDAIVIARKCRYLGRNTLASPGKLLLEAHRLLAARAAREKAI